MSLDSPEQMERIGVGKGMIIPIVFFGLLIEAATLQQAEKEAHAYLTDHRKQHLKRGVALLEKAITDDGERDGGVLIQALLLLAGFYSSLDKPVEAERLMRRALDLIPPEDAETRAATLAGLGALHHQVCDPEGARRQYEKALKSMGAVDGFDKLPVTIWTKKRMAGLK